ncbi:MAG: hypothetical protein Q7T99_16460 [Pseudomonas sp.]|nr:hypothetical protein [Pseudomonas sp.]
MKCKQEKTLDNFTKCSVAKDKLNYRCRSCTSIEKKELYHRKMAANPRFAIERNQKFKANNPTKPAEYSKTFRQRNPELCREYTRSWYEANREKKLKQHKERRLANLDFYLERERNWRRSRSAEGRAKDFATKKHYRTLNAALVNSWTAKRKASINQRTPIWISDADLKAIEDLYIEARRRTDAEGVEYHVDHILPLHGKYVSGLHVPSNMQVLLGIENKIKNNVWRPE